MKRVKMNSKIIIILFILMITYFVIGYSLIKISFYTNKEVTLNYKEKSNVDYKVYLKENSFFESEYLEKNGTYIASLIDYILIDYDYSFKLDKIVDGTYTYYVKGTIDANKSNSKEHYWEKEYILTDKITKNYRGKSVNIKDSTKIDYQTYNELLTDFKNQYGVNMDGELTVTLVVEHNINSNIVDRSVSKDSSASLSIPLTTLTVEVPIDLDNLNNEGTLVSEFTKEKELYYAINKYVGYLCMLIGISILCFIIYILILKSKLENEYNKSIRRIMKTYDNIIVSSKNLPNLDNLNVIDVLSFDELLDAHGEVRNPINCVKGKKSTVFILINDDIAYRYKLVKVEKEL